MKKYKHTWCVLYLLALFALLIPPAYIALGQDEGNGDMPDTETERNDYGIYSRLKGVAETEKEKMADPKLLEETEGTLGQYEFIDSEVDTYDDRTIMTHGVKTPPENVTRETIFDIINDSPVEQQKEIIDLLFDFDVGLIPRPNLAKYWIYTEFMGHEVWTKASLRSTLELYMDNGQLSVIKPPGAKINIDDDTSTGEGNDGVDIEVNLYPELSGPTLTQILQDFLAGEGFNLNMSGGFAFDVDALSQGEIPDEELTLYVLKPIPYEGTNTIIAIGFRFPYVANSFQAKVIVSEILLRNILTDSIEKLINGGLAELGNITVLEAIGGPYLIQYFLGEQLPNLMMSINLGQLISQGDDMYLQTNEIIEIDLQKASGESQIPMSGQIWLNNEGEGLVAPIDEIKWKSNLNNEEGADRLDARLGYMERLDEAMTVAEAYLGGVPENLTITMDYTKVVNGKNVSVVDIDAQSPIGSLDYKAYEFPNVAKYIGENNTTYNHSLFKSVHVHAEDIPKNVHIEVTSDINRELDIPGINQSGNIISRILDTTLIRILERFQRLGKNLRALPENFMTIPGKKGFLHLTTEEDEMLGELQFARSSSHFLKPQGDVAYICSMNLTPYQQDPLVKQLVEDEILPGIALSGRLFNITELHLSFETHTELELISSSDEPLYVELQDPNANAAAYFSNLPEYIKIDAAPEVISFKTSPGAIIKSASIFVEIGDVNVDLTASDIKDGIQINRSGGGAYIGSTGDGELGQVRISVAKGRNTVERLSGNDFAIVTNITKYSSSAFVNIFGLKKIEYVPGDQGVLTIETSRSMPFFMGINNEVDSGGIYARMLIEPLPNNISIALPGVIDVSPIKIPNLSNLTGVLDLTDAIFALGEVGVGIINLMANTSQTFAQSIGGMGSNMDLTYNFDSAIKMDIIAEMRQNFSVNIDEPSWVHGASIKKNESQSENATWAKIFLTGLPSKGSIKSIMDDRVISWNLTFKDMSPRFDYIIIDTQGLRGRKIHSYIGDLKPNMDIILSTYLDTYLGEDVGEMSGNVRIETSEPVGELYMRIIRLDPVPSVREIYLPKIPTYIETDFSLAKTLSIDWSSSDTLDLGYIKMSKLIDGQWRPMVTVLHDVPKEFSMTLRPSLKYHFSAPAPMQGLPIIELEASSPGLDAHITMDGRMGGQKGKINIAIRDLSVSLVTKAGVDSYIIKSVGAIGLISITLSDLPMAKEYQMDYINIEGRDVRSTTISMKMVFGFYPVIRLTDTTAAQIKIKLSGVMEYFGIRRDIKAVIADFRGEVMPAPVGVHSNDIYIESDSKGKIWLIPMPLVTFVFSNG